MSLVPSVELAEQKCRAGITDVIRAVHALTERLASGTAVTKRAHGPGKLRCAAQRLGTNRLVSGILAWTAEPERAELGDENYGISAASWWRLESLMDTSVLADPGDAGIPGRGLGRSTEGMPGTRKEPTDGGAKDPMLLASLRIL